jgi:hypothetical protein
MKRRLVLGLAMSVVAMGSADAATAAEGLPPGVEAALHAKACGVSSISCNQTKLGAIDSLDCAGSNGVFTDIWQFSGIEGTHVAIDASSASMETYLVLRDGESTIRAFDDDSGPVPGSHIEFTLDFTEPWTIEVSNLEPFHFGNYSVTLACTTPPPSGCTADAETLCLGPGGRFKVHAAYETSGSGSGPANVVRLTDDTGYLWFFDAANVEAVVKIINACGFNQRYWVYHAGLTDQGVVLTVTDTGATGQPTKTYTNPLGRTYVTVTDSDAFATCP